MYKENEVGQGFFQLFAQGGGEMKLLEGGQVRICVQSSPIAIVPEAIDVPVQIYFLRNAEHYQRVCGMAQAENNAQTTQKRS